MTSAHVSTDAALDREQRPPSRGSFATLLRKIAATLACILLLALAVPLPLLFAGSIDTVSADARLAVPEALDEWRAAHPECEWLPTHAEGGISAAEGRLACRYTDGISLEGIESFPGERLGGGGFSIDSELDPADMQHPSWWVLGLMFSLYIGVAVAALGMSGWSWRKEKERLGRAISWWLPALVVGLLAVYFSIVTDPYCPTEGAPWHLLVTGPALIGLVVVAGPLAEESVYRQYLHTALGGFPILVAAIVSSLLFALAHLGWLLYDGATMSLGIGLASYFFAGLLFFTVRQVTGAVLPCVLTHAGWNALVVVLTGPS